MRFLAVLAAIAAIVGVIALAQLERVEAGYVGVKVDLLGDDKGVQAEEVGPGRYWIGINEDLYLFPTFSQNYVWTMDETDGSKGDESLTFQSVEGMDIGADVGITYSVDPTKVSTLFQRYRKGIDEITDLYLRNMVRDALVNEASTMKVDLIYGTGKTGLMERAEQSVREQVAQYGILIEKVYWIGSLRLPERVVAAIDAEIAANSQARQRQNEIETARAEAQKERERAQGEADAILLRATAQAEANRILAESLTPEVLQSTALDKWDGVLPRMTGDGAVPMINVEGLMN
ncbi:SPFH domain / band 7 family protein [Bacteriophage DSS3_MAL1]|nr:SPFH domain / band 7 family protein [Bacteriophage DSS3_MAL1]